MKTIKILFIALLLCAATSSNAQVPAGTNYLAETNLLAAYTTLLGGSPTDPNNDIYLAFARLISLPDQATGSNFLNTLNVTKTGRDLYHWQAPLNKVNGHTSVPGGFNGTGFTSEVVGDMVPAFGASETNLAQITDPTFTLYMPQSVTHFGDVTVDYGDVQMLRSILYTAQVWGHIVHSWDFAVTVSTVSNSIGHNGSFQSLLQAAPDLLTQNAPATPDLSAARAAFTNAVNCYITASQFIRNRPPGERRLFNLDTNDYAAEQTFRQKLTDAENSVNGAVVLTGSPNHSIDLQALFNGTKGPRNFFPTNIIGNDFVWGSTPDPTFGGIATGLTTTNVEKVIVKKLKLGAELRLPGVTFTDVGSLGGDAYAASGVVDIGGTLYGSAPYGGNYGGGTIFKVTSSGTFSTLYTFDFDTNNYDYPDGGNPNPVIAANNGFLYGTTSQGGSNNNGNIFQVSTGGNLKVIYSFGDGNDDGAYNSFAPLVQRASDGVLFGTTSAGGNNGNGIIFSINPSTANPNFQDLYDFQQSEGGSPTALVIGPDGNLYGSTLSGGDFGLGSVFQYNIQQGVLNTLYSFGQEADDFGNPIDGAYPGPVVFGTDGNLYGTTEYGGTNQFDFGIGDGSIFEVSTDGSFTSIYSFDQNNFDGYYPVGTLAPAGTGSFIGVTSAGGANKKGAIFKFNVGANATSEVWFTKTLGGDPAPYSSQGLLNGDGGDNGSYGNSYYNLGIALASDGNYYGVTADGGSDGNGTAYRLNVKNVPVILNPPVGFVVTGGTATNLTVTASGTGTLTYQWMKNGSKVSNGGDVSGATTSTLSFSGITGSDAGSYTVVVGNASGSVTSSVAVVAVLLPPAIVPPLLAARVTAFAGATVSLKVSATGASLNYQWNKNNLALENAGDFSGAFTSNLVIHPATNTDSGSYTVVVSNQNGSITSAVCAVTISTDAGAPSVTITTPAANARIVPSAFTGTAADATFVDHVNYWITNLLSKGVVSGRAALTAGTTSSNWSISANVQYPAGSNVLAVRSYDFSGNPSPIVSHPFFLKTTSELLLTQSGTGTGTLTGKAIVAGDNTPANGVSLTVGDSFSILATPNSNSIFVNWTGVQFDPVGPVTNTTLTFVMENGTSIQANFVTNPYIAGIGTYDGLFTNANGITAETAGMFHNVTVKTNGLFTGQVLINGGGPYAIQGQFDLDGNTTITNVKTAGGTLTLTLALSINVGLPPQIIGTVTSSSNWSASLVANRGSANLGSGQFALLMQPSVQQGVGIANVAVVPSSPPGISYALITNHLGTNTLTGNLADGTALTESATVSEDGDFPVYINPYSKSSGVLFGWINLTNGSSVSNLTWIKKAAKSPAFYIEGFTNVVMAQISGWTNLPNLANVIAADSTLTISGPGLLAPLTFVVSNPANDTLVKITAGSPTNSLTGSFNPSTGKLTLNFGNGKGTTTVQAVGAILQNGGGAGGYSAGGYYLGTTNAGSFIIEPGVPVVGDLGGFQNQNYYPAAGDPAVQAPNLMPPAWSGGGGQ